MRSLPLALACLTLGCAAAKIPSSPCTPVGELPGPEDFDYAELDGRPVLLASAAARREGQSQDDNGIWLIDPATNEARELPLHGRDSCSLSPHGVATAELEPGRWHLWVVVHHEPEPCEGQRHGIEHYELAADGLHFIERLTGPELRNPNDLDALPDGRLWMSDNPPWEGGKGMVGDLLFRRAKGRIVHYDPAKASFSVAAEGLLFPNGVAVIGEQLWVSAAYGKLFRVELGEGGVAGEREQWRTKPKASLDNLMLHERELWVTGHPKGLKFLQHAKRPRVHAPTIAYRIALDDDSSSSSIRAVAHWREGEVDAGSTVWPFEGQLVLGQVFDPGLQVCAMPE